MRYANHALLRRCGHPISKVNLHSKYVCVEQERDDVSGSREGERDSKEDGDEIDVEREPNESE